MHEKTISLRYFNRLEALNTMQFQETSKQLTQTMSDSLRETKPTITLLTLPDELLLKILCCLVYDCDVLTLNNVAESCQKLKAIKNDPVLQSVLHTLLFQKCCIKDSSSITVCPVNDAFVIMPPKLRAQHFSDITEQLLAAPRNSF